MYNQQRKHQQRIKKLRTIKVRYQLKNQAPKHTYNLDFNSPQFLALDEARENMRNKLSVEVSRAVVIRAAVREYASLIQDTISRNDSSENKHLLQQLEEAAADR
jgi:hypothetical protein